MADLVGGAFLTVMFEKLFDRLASSDLRQSSVASKLEELEAKLNKVSIFLNDAEDRQIVDDNVKEWLDQFKHVIFMADDLVEQINDSEKDKNLKRKADDLVGFCKYANHSLAMTVPDEIDLILREFDGLYGRAHDLELKCISNSADPYKRSSPIAPLPEEHYVYHAFNERNDFQIDDCWSIFAHHAFNGETDADPQLQAIGRRIVEKCKGLPLAIRCLGDLLRSERSPQKWENILRSDFGDWSEVMENGVLPSLWLSYRYLSSTLKQCLAYCSLFPQDYRFSKKEMVPLWMAEGFVRSNDEGKSMEDVGEEHFDDLVSRSLFQRSSEDDDTYFVHDLVHDLAAFVYGKFCFRMGDVAMSTHHLTYGGNVSSKLLTCLSTPKHLRTLMNIPLYSLKVQTDNFLKEIVLKVRCLRVVSVRLKSSIVCHLLGELKMLRYLNLFSSEIQDLPDSICSLFHLQTLILRSCYMITRLPMDLPRKLSKLRHLDTFGTSLRKMPPKMGSLKELRVLTEFVVGEGDGSGCSTLKDLGELHHLRGELRIIDLENVDNVPNARILRDKAEMKELALFWKGNARGNMIDKAVVVLDALQPHVNLEKLEVWNYLGSSFPKWVGEMSFSKMVFVHLNGGGCRFLPPLGQLPSLRKLTISNFGRVEEVGNEFLYGNDTNSSITPFPSLESLEFRSMTSWKEWSFVENGSGCFPRLEYLSLEQCPELECINREDEDHDDDECEEMESTKLHHRCPSLSKLTIYSCYLLEMRYQKYEGDGWHYISHIPTIEISGDTTDQLQPESEREEHESSEAEMESESETE